MPVAVVVGVLPNQSFCLLITHRLKGVVAKRVLNVAVMKLSVKSQQHIGRWKSKPQALAI